MSQYSFPVEKSSRLDQFLCEQMEKLSRNRLHELIREGQVKLNGKLCQKKAQKLKSGDIVELEIPEARPLDTPAQDLNLKILFEDESLAAVIKPSGMLTHPTHPGQGGTMVSGLLHSLKSLSSINGVMRPGIVHRLDRDTSGILVVAKNDASHQGLQKMFQERNIQKTYLAMAYGNLDNLRNYSEIEAGSPLGSNWLQCALPLGRDPKRRKLRQVREDGKPALSCFRIIKSWFRFHLLQIRIQTGRTHQIRVHLAAMGIPLIQDLVYGGRDLSRWVKRPQLHSFSLKFLHPESNLPLYFRAPLQEDMLQLIGRLNEGQKYVW